MKLFISGIVPALMLVLCLSGCMNFKYVGQSFAPKSDSFPVNFIKGKEKVSSDQYRIIGRGILTGPNSTDEYDRMAELRSEARKHGADAVCIVGESVNAAGIYPRSKGSFAPPLSSGSNRDNLNPEGEAWETDSFGKEQSLNAAEKVRFTFETKVIFLKKTADFNKEMESRSSFL